MKWLLPWGSETGKLYAFQTVNANSTLLTICELDEEALMKNGLHWVEMLHLLRRRRSITIRLGLAFVDYTKG